MKITTLFFLLSFSFALSAQRGEVPTENPDNALDLKVVYQEYTITTTYQHGGSTSEKDEYLNLKVNDLYLPEGNTGISKMHFQRYLTNCPQALDLGLDGLNMYNKATSQYRIGNWAMAGGFAVSGYAFFTRDPDDINTVAFFAPALSGLLAKYIFKRRGRKIERQADQMIVDAFGHYTENCFREDLYTPPSAYDPDGPETAENGETNNNEDVMIDMISNNAKGRFYSINALGGFQMLDAIAVTVGPEFAYYKKGLYFNAKGQWNKSIGADLPSDVGTEFSGSALVSIPFIKGVKQPKKSFLYLGNVQGMEAMATSDEMKMDVYKALSLDLGADYYQQFSDNIGLTNSYFVKSTLLRGGISRSIFTETSFKINDNRFSEKTRYSSTLARFYVNAIYNYNNEYDIFPSSTIPGIYDDPSLESELGFALGMDIKFAKKRKNGTVSINVEAGKFPIYNDINRWAVLFKMGYGFYSMDRGSAKRRGQSGRTKNSVGKTNRY